MIVLIYILIGFIVAAINNYLWIKLESPEERLSENAMMIIALVLWIILWPISLIATISMIHELHRIKHNKYGNNKS